MKKLLFLLIFLPILNSCQSPKKVKIDERFLGSWEMLMIDHDTKNTLDTLTVVYKNNGIVSYSSKGPFYYIDGSSKENHIWTERYYLTDRQTIVIIDENSEKSEAKYKFITNDKLQLNYEGNIQILTKIK